MNKIDKNHILRKLIILVKAALKLSQIRTEFIKEVSAIKKNKVCVGGVRIENVGSDFNRMVR